MIPKVYLAASYKDQKRMRGVRDFLQDDFGYVVVSTWIDQEEEGLDVDLINYAPDKAAYKAKADISDIMVADIVVVFTEVRSTTGGRQFEHGLATALGKSVVIVGPRESVFQCLEYQVYLPDYNAFIEYVRRINAAKEGYPDTPTIPPQGKGISGSY